MTDLPTRDVAENDDLARIRALMEAAARAPGEGFAEMTAQASDAAAAADVLLRASRRQAETFSRGHSARARAAARRLGGAFGEDAAATTPERLAAAFGAYLRDAAERWILTLDVLRERGDVFLAHEAAGCPPVLAYEHETVMDGADLPRPCNYRLLRIVPPEGVEVLDAKRPYVIIDPRAGHGGGIGGFKPDSQVGVALKDGHPVYFVDFRRDPVPGQTLADVCRAEAAFVREVERRHPDSPKPVVAGNCQGGWATLLLAATHPDLTGPIVLNGAPVATWSGAVGSNPMRYNGGVLGGTWQPMFWSDLGGGVFDGAHLVMNFEQLNPSRNHFRKYYDLYADVDAGRERFLEFERWWGGFFRLNEPEIRWIVEQLFVGNKLVKNTAQLETGRPVDVKRVQAPIIVFASHGDDITPPRQALNWIVDTYADVEEIRIRGQRIVYMIHEDVGHLGIFVSSRIARKEHSEVASTMKTIEALAPGLYEMKVDDAVGAGLDRSYLVSFHERTLDDLSAVDDDREDERPFAAVQRVSELQAEAYDLFLRPWVRAAVSKPLAETVRAMHPLRAQRSLLSSSNPFTAPLEAAARMVRASRAPVGEDNPFRRSERVAADLVEQWMDVGRDLRDASYEMLFFTLWGGPWARSIGRPAALRRALETPEELRTLPEVLAALDGIARGGFAAAVIRMLVLLVESRGSVRRDRLERSARMLTQDEPFRSLAVDQRARLIREQTLIVTFEPERAVETLPDLLPDPALRELAAAAVQYVPGPIAEMSPATLAALQRMRAVLGLPPAAGDVTEDPLRDLEADAPAGVAAP